MPTNPEQFRKEFSKSGWIFDLFAHGYDFLNGRFLPTADPALERTWELEHKQIKQADIASQIVRADGLIPLEVRQYLRFPGGDAGLQDPEFYIRLFSILQVVDEVAADMNHLGAMRNQKGGRWARTTEHFERNKNQLQWQALGYVVFKHRYFKEGPAQAWLELAVKNEKVWKQIPPRGQYLDNHFQNLLRVPASEDCKLDFRVLAAVQDFHDLNWDKLRLGFVPLIERLNVRPAYAELMPGPLVLKKQSDEPPTFGIQVEDPPPANCSDLYDRAEAALRYLAKKGCQIVLFPEMVMPDPVVNRLRTVLSDLALQDEPRPGLVLAGTFTRIVQHYPESLPFNVAVMLNHCGEELWRQRKMQPYDMHRYEQENFGLDKLLNSDSCRESIAFSNRKLRLVDSPATGMRIMVLICEDVTRDPGLRVAHQLQPSLILAPVMAGPLTAAGGFGKKISDAQERAASIFAVANSGALARAAWKTKPGSPPLALVGLPLLNVAKDFVALDEVAKTESVPGVPDLQVLIYEFPT